MNKNDLKENLNHFIELHLLNEYSKNTLNQYRQNIQFFIDWIPNDSELTKTLMMEYKDYLTKKYSSSRSINTNIVTVNKFLKWMSKEDKSSLDLKGIKCDLCIKKIKIQQKTSNEDVISTTDYKRLLRISKRIGNMQLHYIIKVLAMTGIRISELEYFTVENLKKSKNYIKVFNKGKEREIIIRQDLSRELKKYCKEQGIKEGYIFKGQKEGKMPSQSTIWRQMKKVAGIARVNKKKIHAHSFRHLFAQIFLNTYDNNITELADILGHNSLDTTRLYTRTSSEQKRHKLEKIKY